MKRSLSARLVLVLAAGLLAAACSTSPAAPSASAVNFQAELTAVGSGLDAALVAYKAGDATKADQLVGDAYLEHFEYVEGPLGKVDNDFMENLEDLIRGDIRDAIKAGKPVSEVEALVTKAKTDLATAATKLQ